MKVLTDWANQCRQNLNPEERLNQWTELACSPQNLPSVTNNINLCIDHHDHQHMDEKMKEDKSTKSKTQSYQNHANSVWYCFSKLCTDHSLFNLIILTRSFSVSKQKKHLKSIVQKCVVIISFLTSVAQNVIRIGNLKAARYQFMDHYPTKSIRMSF